MIKEIRAYPNGINSKVNLIVRLEFELTYFETAIQYFSNYAT